jgi:hypothetical protein
VTEFDQQVTVFTLRAEDLPSGQRDVVSSYCRAFALRHLFIKPEANLGVGPYLFAGDSPLGDEGLSCYWNTGDNGDLDAHAQGCTWVWHHGPTKELLATSDPRVIVLPRNDLFEIRGIANTPEAWAEYRARIDSPWSEKRPEIYFRGEFTGGKSLEGPRALACRLIEDAGLPANVGVLEAAVPPDLRPHVVMKEPEPLAAMADYKFVLSVWGNHPFNPRLYRGLEAGSLVFHQATPTVRLLDDGLLVPGQHYVEIAPDLGDLVEKVDHFMRHPSEARAIAEAGHQAWMDTLFVSTPYTMPEVIWERFTSQPNWREFRDTFAIP